MTTVGSYHAKTHLPALLERVARGEKIIITRRGAPIAMLSPAPQQEKEDIAKVVEEMLAYRDKHGPRLKGLSIRSLIEEGRRY